MLLFIYHDILLFSLKGHFWIWRTDKCSEGGVHRRYVLIMLSPFTDRPSSRFCCVKITMRMRMIIMINNTNNDNNNNDNNNNDNNNNDNNERKEENKNNDNDDNDNNNNEINICIVPFQCKMFRSFGKILVRFYTLGILYVWPHFHTSAFIMGLSSLTRFFLYPAFIWQIYNVYCLKGLLMRNTLSITKVTTSQGRLRVWDESTKSMLQFTAMVWNINVILTG